MTVDYKAGKISSLSFAQVNFLAGDAPPVSHLPAM